MAGSLNVAVLGPKGQCGQCVVDELLSRGHSVVGISRSPPTTWNKPGKYSALPVDFHHEDQLAAALSSGGFDAVVSAFGPPMTNMKDIYRLGVEGHSKIKTAILKSTYRGPFIIIGGAGSLHLRTGKQLCDANGFAYSYWYKWPDAHLDYMRARMLDHGQRGFSTFIYLFKWARSNYQNPGWFSWLGRMFAWLFHVSAKKTLTDPDAIGLILCSRIALSMWEGVTDVQWSFLSPPWLLRDKGLRTGQYEIHIDKDEGSEEAGIYGGIYNEDMAVAIVDEVETRKLTHVHWTCTGPIGLKHW